MPPDRLLTTVLRGYQGPSNPVQFDRLLSTTTSLLTTLSNPLNVTLLTSQLLTAPAIWNQAGGLGICLRIISVYNTAAITVQKHEHEGLNTGQTFDAYQPRRGGGISCDEWAKAVIKGADERSPRWQHLLVICGVLLGMEGKERRGLSRGLREKLEEAMITAANIALEDAMGGGALGAEAVVLALNHAFPLLSDKVRMGLDYDALVLIALKAVTSSGGYEDGSFLDSIDYDVQRVPGNQFDWSAQSPSFLRLQTLATKPLISSMGPLARLVAQCIEHMSKSLRVVEICEHLQNFTNRLLSSWRHNKLSEIDPSEEGRFLTPETLQVTFPALWQVLKTSMFATVVILRAVIGRTLIDPVLSRNFLAPTTASQALTILRNIHFISSRLGSNSFSSYTFVNLASIDILSRFPIQSRDFLEQIYFSQAGKIPNHPLQRNLDLFYLNASEHFTLVLSPSDNESLIVTAASPYLDPTANANLLEIFEAAHSAMLAVLGVPQNAELTARILPFYVESLFRSFPTNLSPRQFQFAFKTLLQITTPPSPLSASHPTLAETLLELIYHRAIHAPTPPLPPSTSLKRGDTQLQEPQLPLSEQAVLMLTLLDALPNLPLWLLEEWLPLTADLLNMIDNEGMRENCKARFWEVLESGEMDVERSTVCVAWWGSRGGREKVLFGNENKEGPFMSGGLREQGDGSKL
ncbi:hypothetical protein B7494_g760 [Chlorociboria aeruginascens]|nr:hypothetical protein B7494_g760 [Chlorociboria aeruginascens]